MTMTDLVSQTFLSLIMITVSFVAGGTAAEESRWLLMGAAALVAILSVLL